MFRKVVSVALVALTLVAALGFVASSEAAEPSTKVSWEVNPSDYHPLRTAAVYCMEDGDIEVWGVVDSVGDLAFRVSVEELLAVDEVPTEDTLIQSADGISLYRLTIGEFQVTAPDQNGNPNGYELVWDACYPMVEDEA